VNLIAADRPMFCTWTLDYKKWDETLKDEHWQDTYFKGWKKLKRLLKNPKD
jgi:type I restriction enzyme M protein